MAYRSRKERRRASGGATDCPSEDRNAEEHDKRGGRVKRKDGGHVEGGKSRANLGKRSRSGFSAAHNTSGPERGPEPATLASGGGIHIKASHKGLLHKDLGVAPGKPISTSTLEKAKSGASTAEKKRIVFAENARKWHH